MRFRKRKGHCGLQKKMKKMSTVMAKNENEKYQCGKIKKRTEIPSIRSRLSLRGLLWMDD